MNVDRALLGLAVGALVLRALRGASLPDDLERMQHAAVRGQQLINLAARASGQPETTARTARARRQGQ
jgi:hypothetical protein